jgi:hypothetical protein
MHRPVLMLLAAVVAILAIAPVSHACSVRPRPSDEQLFDRASEVFIAKVDSVKLVRMPKRLCDGDEEECEYVRGTYALVETLKGNPRRSGHVNDMILGPGNCSLGLFPGWYYVFYVSDRERFVLHPGGSFAIGPYPDEGQINDARAVKEHPHSRPRDEG